MAISGKWEAIARKVKTTPQIIMGVAKPTRVVNNNEIKRENQIFIFFIPLRDGKCIDLLKVNRNFYFSFAV